MDTRVICNLKTGAVTAAPHEVPEHDQQRAETGAAQPPIRKIRE